jgi:NDP-sugar pyrophosphorylase family protein
MKAMILAAGLGTRLRPLTNDRPKALVELNNRTLLEITITRLRTFGVTEAIINVHHFAGMVIDYLKSKNNFNMRLEISREDDQLLDTGGGLKKAAWFFQENPTRPEEPFFLHNVDVISNIDLNAMLRFHKHHDALAIVAVQSRQSSRQLLFNDQLQLSGRRIGDQDFVIDEKFVIPSETRNLLLPREGTASAVPKRQNDAGALAPDVKFSQHLNALAFSGIHILSPRILPKLTETAPFSIIDSYLRLSSASQKILAFRHDTSYWRDLGKPTDLAQAAQDLQANILPS